MTPDHETHIRNDQTRKCIDDAKTGDIVTLYGTPWLVIGFSDRPTALLARVGFEQEPVNHRTHHSVCLGSEHARDFLLPDQQEASEPLSSAQPYAAPVDHGPGADAMEETGNTCKISGATLPPEPVVKTYEDGVRDALDALPERPCLYRSEAIKAIEALLPRDPVKALVDSVIGETEAFSRDKKAGMMLLAERLISTGRLATQGEVR